jgi:hypothetical protein
MYLLLQFPWGTTLIGSAVILVIGNPPLLRLGRVLLGQEDISQNGLGLEPRLEDLQTLQGRHTN